MKIIPILLFVFIATSACGQTIQNNQSSTNNTIVTNMDLSNITNETVKSALEALQANNIEAWYVHFTDDAVFTDDGRILDFKSFFDNAFDHKEKFLTLDKIENEGKNLTGNFFAGQWGTFKVFFNFTVDEHGKISRLDIGQIR